jgi:ribosomal protein S21
MKVKVAGGDVEAALGELRRAMRFGGPPAHLKSPSHYEKPSERRRRKKRLAELRERQRLVRPWSDDWRVAGEFAASRRLEWFRWASSVCQCVSCRWLRGDLDPPPQ